MAFTNYKQLKDFIIQTLRWKATPAFAKEARYGVYTFKGFVYPWARFFFPRISRISTTDEAFLKEFTREDYAKYPILLQEIAEIGKTEQEQTQIITRANQQAAREETSAVKETVPQEPTHLTKTDETEKTPVPEAFNKAFENEPEFKTNPSVAPSSPQIQIPKVPSGLTSSLKNAASGSGVFFQRNIGKFLTPQTLATGATTVLGGIVGGGLTGGSSLGVFAGAVGGATVPSFIKSGAAGPILSRAGNGAANFLSNFSGNVSGPRFNPRFRGAGTLKKFGTGRKVALAFLIFGIFFGFSLIAGIVNPGNTPTSEASPVSSTTISGADYTLPLRDPSISATDIKSQILQSWPNAQINNWQIIIDQAKLHNWNPALILALWIEESGAQGTSSYTDALGCAPGQPTTDINLSLGCLFNNFSIFTNDQFPLFMARYSGGPAENPFANNPNFPGNLKIWYSKLVPSGVGAITTITNTVGSCPAIGKISAPYGFNIPDYPDVGNEGCGNLPKCHNAIDIAANEGSSVKSTLEGTVTFVGSERFKGNYIEITDTTGLVATFEHLSSITPTLNTRVSKGAMIGTVGHSGEGVTGPVLHYKLKRGGILLNPFRTLGSSATLDPQALAISDDISQNNYLNRIPNDSSGYWGSCNQ